MKPDSIKSLIDNKVFNTDTVNSNKEFNNTVNCETVKEEYRDLENRSDIFLNELKGKPEYVADKLSRELDDMNSLHYYLLLAKNNPPEKLFEALSYVKIVSNEGKIRTKKAIYFISILKRWGFTTKFKI